jgi:CBS domain-containing protein
LSALAEPEEPVTLGVDVDVPLEDAVAVMTRTSQTRLPVTADARVIGFVTRRDMARSLALRPSMSDL